ncbi:fatty-acid amide hydrolase 2, partial [Lasius niger]
MSYSVGVKDTPSRATSDANVVTKIREAGGIPLLVSNTPELCLWWHTFNKVTGSTKNPYDTRRTAGGSSGGEAALLGAGASLLSLASDIAGSARLPAMFCGVFGHKPTPNWVSVEGHKPGSSDKNWSSFFAIGPMVRYASDLPLLLTVISQTDEARIGFNKKANLEDMKTSLELSGFILLRIQDIYSMFNRSDDSKFRASLGKSKIIHHGDSILVDHLGELNSTVLLHLIKSGMSESAHKKLIFKTIVLYIDDGATMGRTIDERNILQRKIAKEIKDFGFNGYVVSLNQVLSEEDALDIKSIDQDVYHEHEDRLRAILDNLPDNTSRTDLLNQLRRRLLVSAARKLSCNKVFVADSAMDIATKALGDICLGRGAQLSTLANFCDARCADIKILKPLRNFTQQELIYYSEHYEIKSVKLREFNVTTPATSIQALAHNFTAGLESQFSGTVSTIFRTAEKISPRINAQQNAEDNCVLCDARLDATSSNDEVSAVRAIEVS